MCKRVLERLTVVAADAGSFSARNEAEAQKMGVKHVAVPNRSTKSPARRQHQRQRWFRRAQKCISEECATNVLAHVSGMLKCRPLLLGGGLFMYGTTADGGASCGCGTVFQLTRGGKLTTLHNFGMTDGTTPVAGLVQANDGSFYGTTSAGGSGTACLSGCGAVFRITPAGAFTTLYNFDGNDGVNPLAPLIQASDGNFYGTTQGAAP